MDGLNIRKPCAKRSIPVRNYRSTRINKDVSNGASPIQNYRANGKEKDVLNGASIRNLSGQGLPISSGAAKKLIREIFQWLNNAKQPSSLPEEEWSLGIVFLNDARIKALNQKYLKADRPTDVLAFNYGQNTADLAISLESAKRNAQFYKAPLKKELIGYIIHGILHLYGYDDRNPKEKKIMFRRQEEILKRIMKI